MKLLLLFLSTLFACAVCHIPTQSSNTRRNDLSLSKRGWTAFPAVPQRPSPKNQPASMEGQTYLAPSPKLPVQYVDHGTQTDPVHGCRPGSILGAWESKQRTKIKNWPDGIAYETTFDGQAAIITKEVALSSTKLAQCDTERRVLSNVGQLLAYGTKKGVLGHTTVYIVRKQMGDSLGVAVQNHLSIEAINGLVKEAEKRYQSIGVFPGAAHNGDVRLEFAFEKNSKGHYVKAHRIAWRGKTSKMPLPEAKDVHYCVQWW